MTNKLLTQFKCLTRQKQLVECTRWAEQLKKWKEASIGMCPVPKDAIIILSQLNDALSRVR